MSVATELQRIIDAKAGLKTAIEAKGITVSSSALIDDYADYVDSIPSGGGVKVEEKLLNFYDYEGTLVASYDGSEIAGLTALPNAPDHSTDDVPLTFDGWNWTLAKIQAYHTNYPDAVIIVGANYHTIDGKTHILFEIPENDTTGVRIQFYSSSAYGTVDWGDGITEAISGAVITHIYQNAGTYDCKVEAGSTEVSAGAASNNNLIPLARKVIRVWLASSVTRIGTWKYCINLKSISIPSSVSSYTDNSLPRCYNLECIVLPDSNMSSPGPSLVERDYNLRVLSYPDNKNAFANNLYYNYSLKYLTVPSEMTWFRGTSDLYSLRKITIPAGVTSLGNQAFYKAYSLESASLDKCTSYTGASDESQTFMDCYNLVSCKLPSSLTKIPYGFFSNCYSLTDVNIPNGVTTIDNSAFSSCYSLSEIEIPSSVTSIVNSAFQNCSGLLSITIKATTPPTLGNTSALPTNTGMKIYVPAGTLTTYQAATNWSNFASYMEELPE